MMFCFVSMDHRHLHNIIFKLVLAHCQHVNKYTLNVFKHQQTRTKQKKLVIFIFVFRSEYNDYLDNFVYNKIIR